jgi:hypothetical protein
MRNRSGLRGVVLATGVLGLVLVGACTDSQPTLLEPEARAMVVQRALAQGTQAGSLHNDLLRSLYSDLTEEREAKGLLTRRSLETVSMRSCRDWVKRMRAANDTCGQL